MIPDLDLWRGGALSKIWHPQPGAVEVSGPWKGYDDIPGDKVVAIDFSFRHAIGRSMFRLAVRAPGYAKIIAAMLATDRDALLTALADQLNTDEAYALADATLLNQRIVEAEDAKVLAVAGEVLDAAVDMLVREP
jgi:hypothetical protein